MIPLGTGDIPTTGSELAQRVTNVLKDIITKGTPATVSCEMDQPAQINNFQLGVTEAECGAAKMTRPAGFTRLNNVDVKSFAITGKPLRIFGAPVDVDMQASDFPMSWSRDDQGNLWLVPAESGDSSQNTQGRMEIAAEVSQLERAIETAVSAMADQNGAKLKGLKLTIVAAGPRALAARVDVAATKFMMTAKIGIVAEIALDDKMNLRVGKLEANGDGAAGGMVANMLADKLKAFQGREIALGQFVFSGAALQDVQLSVDDKIRLNARFGKS